MKLNDLHGDPTKFDSTDLLDICINVDIEIIAASLFWVRTMNKDLLLWFEMRIRVRLVLKILVV